MKARRAQENLRRFQQRVQVVCLAFGLMTAGGTAVAVDVDWLSVGANVGGATRSHGASLIVGGEAALGYRWDLGRGPWAFAWRGAYADVLYETESNALRLSLGPEVGFLALGIDGGPVLELRKGRVFGGFVVRPHLSFGYVIPYARLVCCFDESKPFGEFGVLLKYPIGFDAAPR